jgi:hypothetical protein
MEMNMDPMKETFIAVKNGSVGVIKVSSAYFFGRGSSKQPELPAPIGF